MKCSAISTPQWLGVSKLRQSVHQVPYIHRIITNLEVIPPFIPTIRSFKILYFTKDDYFFHQILHVLLS